MLRGALILGRHANTKFMDVFNHLSGKDGPSIYGGGGLGIQLIIAVASLAGCFGHTRFLSGGCICDGTLTAKKLSNVFGLGVTSGNRLIATVASDNQVTEMTVENTLCTYMQDVDIICDFDGSKYDQKVNARMCVGDKLSHCDTFFSDQWIFYPEASNDEIFIVITALSDDGASEVQVPFFHINVQEEGYHTSLIPTNPLVARRLERL